MSEQGHADILWQQFAFNASARLTFSAPSAMMFTINLAPVSSSASAARSRLTATVNPGGSKLACGVGGAGRRSTNKSYGA